MNEALTGHDAALEIGDRGGARVLRLRGRLDVGTVGRLWTPFLQAARQARGRPLVLDLVALTSSDTAGAALLLEAERVHGGETVVEGAEAKIQDILARIRESTVPSSVPAVPPPPLSLRDVAWAGLRTAGDGIAFLGEVLVALMRLPVRTRMFRFGDLLRTADQAGVRAMPLVLLLGTLIGLILAFQSLVPMRRFGADVYVANLVAIGLTRELGPLLAAVILAGRSGSAFAAEIGTMKVNQEIDALITMGIDPVTLLVLPRLLATLFIMPILAIVLILAGLLGMSLVLVSSGIPLITIGNQVAWQVVPLDLYGGLFKAAVFGAVIAAIGCRAGLSTGLGPRAVGISTTEAVVGGIVAAIALDGVFAVIFYQLGM